MLQSMRSYLKGGVAYVLIGLIIIVFALFGVESLFSGAGLNRDSVAEVNGQPITELDMARGLAQQKQQLRNMMGDKMDPRFLEDSFLRPTVKNGLIQRALLKSAANKDGLRVDTRELDKDILEDRTFQRDGRFDADLYKSILRQYGFLPTTYREELNNNQIITQYQKAFLETGFVTEKEVLTLAQLQFEKRDFEFVSLSLSQASAGINPSAEELATYYDQHKTEFFSDEAAAVEYILLDKQALSDSLVVSEDEIKNQYQAEVTAAHDQVERHAAHILVEEKADGSYLSLLSDLQEKIKNGADFSELAKQYSADKGSASNGGDVGVTTGSSFVKEFEETLATLSVGAVSEPVKTQFGYHIIKLLDKKEAQIPTLEASRKRIEQQLRGALADDSFAEKVEMLQEEGKRAVSLSSIAENISKQGYVVSAEKTALFSRKNPSALFASNQFLANPKVMQSVFVDGVQVGMMTDVLELSPQHTVIMQITDHKPATEQPLDAVRNQVQAQYKQEMAAKQLSDRATALLAEVLAGEALKVAAEKQGLSIQNAKDKLRSNSEPDAGVLEKAFAMSKPQGGNPSADIVQLNNGDWALVQLLTSKTPAASEITEQQKKEIQQRLQSAAGNGDFSAVIAMLIKEAKIVNRSQALTAPQ